MKKYILYLFFTKSAFSIERNEIIQKGNKNTFCEIINQKKIEKFYDQCLILFKNVNYYFKNKKKDSAILLKNELKKATLEEKLNPKEKLEINLCINYPFLTDLIRKNIAVADMLKKTYLDNRNDDTFKTYFNRVIFKNLKKGDYIKSEIIELYEDNYLSYSEFFKNLVDDIVIELIQEEATEEEERRKERTKVDLVPKDIELLKHLFEKYDERKKQYHAFYESLEGLITISEFTISEENPDSDEIEKRDVLIAETIENIIKKLKKATFLSDTERNRYEIIMQRFQFTYLKEKDQWDKFIREFDNLIKEYERKKSEKDTQMTEEEGENKKLPHQLYEKLVQINKTKTPGE
jgi:hypothetical protein